MWPHWNLTVITSPFKARLYKPTTRWDKMETKFQRRPLLRKLNPPLMCSKWMQKTRKQSLNVSHRLRPQRTMSAQTNPWLSTKTKTKTKKKTKTRYRKIKLKNIKITWMNSQMMKKCKRVNTMKKVNTNLKSWTLLSKTWCLTITQNSLKFKRLCTWPKHPRRLKRCNLLQLHW